MAAEFGARVTVSVEDYGNSHMADRFGVRRYPVVFVDDVLLARPKDFGFGGPEDVSAGLYVPWLQPASQKKFKDDLRRAVGRHLAGQQITGFDVADVAAPADAADGPARFPTLTLHDRDGQAIEAASVSGRTVVVEMWATWCPPCRSTLAWLDTLQRQHADSLTVIAIAVDSPPEEVATMLASRTPSYRVVMGTPDVIAAFGAVAAVPKLFVFDATGARTRVFYGAPPDLHDQIQKAIRPR